MVSIHPAVPSNDIGVSVIEGIAKLKGSVDNILAQEHPTRIAETVKGFAPWST
jgi:osmotically-inducible protein OsmY